MDYEYHRSVYRNSSITLLDSYYAIEKFLLETRLAFFDQWKLFDLLHLLLPKEENQLTCQGFLTWIVHRMEEHRTSSTPPVENQPPTKRFRTTESSGRIRWNFNSILDQCV